MASLATGGLGIKNPNDMYVSMLKSRTVEDAIGVTIWADAGVPLEISVRCAPHI